MGYKAKLYTNHQALMFINSCNHTNAWLKSLEAFQLEIIYRKGPENQAVYVLSRYPSVTNNKVYHKEHEAFIALTNFKTIKEYKIFDELIVWQNVDECLKQIITQCKQ